MSSRGIRAAFSSWPDFNDRLRERVANLTEEQLAIVPEPGRWPLWATIGHLACQRVFGLCDVAGEPGAA
ncbi:MAG TPA: DinB family protein, partial [Candidatus Limnocylindrales bacterium]|nr:DinB family protein [Candidatus Limnocylindrales bacterium]